MVQSRCLKCDSSHFEVVHANLEGSARPILFVQCADCGAVVGALDFLNISVKAERVKNELKMKLETFLKQLENSRRNNA